MLELRPNCEHCGKGLPPAATDAMICSFECTFCRDCVEIVLANVCPNCGGGFCPRPIRPHRPYVGDSSLVKHPASTRFKHKPADLTVHAALAAVLKAVAPEKR